MTDAQTTYDRAKSAYDKNHERALMEATTRAIFESSTVSDANAIVIQTAEAAEASEDLQEFVRRTLNGTGTEGTA